MTLSDILNDAEPGEVIDLGGAIVGPCYERGHVFDPPITIRNAVLDAGSDTPRAFRFDNCRGILFEHIELRGRDRTSSGFMFNRCRDMAVSRMFAHGLSSGMTLNQCDGFVLQDSHFTNIRKDAFTSGGSRRVDVLRNYGTNFSPINTGGAGDHPDFIQFWPLYGSDNSFINIEDNYFERGDGLPVQGGFVRGVYEKDGVPYRPQFGEVNMRRNVFLGTLYNGISLSGVNAGEIVDNMIISARDAAGTLVDKHSWLRVDRCAPAVTVARNSAEAFIGDVDEALNTQAIVKDWPKPPSIECGLLADLTEAAEPPVVTFPAEPTDPDPESPAPGGDEPMADLPSPAMPEKPWAERPGNPDDIARLRKQLAERDRMLDERFAMAENLFDQLRYHRAERRKEANALNRALAAATAA